jgi:hypothetical protein
LRSSWTACFRPFTSLSRASIRLSRASRRSSKLRLLSAPGSFHSSCDPLWSLCFGADFSRSQTALNQDDARLGNAAAGPFVAVLTSGTDNDRDCLCPLPRSSRNRCYKPSRPKVTPKVENAFRARLASARRVGRSRPRPLSFSWRDSYGWSMIATARVQPAEAARTFTGKHDTTKPYGGSASKLCSFSRWQ